MSLKKVMYRLLLASFLLPVTNLYAKDQVLIMTISEYLGIDTLKGVKFDQANAKQLAEKLGFDTSNATVAKDSSLNADGLRSTLNNFASSIQPGDRAFIYYSGHGASFKNQNNVCEQSILAHDAMENSAGNITTAELSAFGDKIKSKVSDALIIFDSCYSGGHKEMAVARGLSDKKQKTILSTKAWIPKGNEKCDIPQNRVAKSFTLSKDGSRDVSKSMSNSEFNFTVISASTDKEEALDVSTEGGLATLGLLKCANKGAVDLNGNAGVEYADLVSCAQEYINEQVPKISENYKPHHIQLEGNTQRPTPVKISAQSNINQTDAQKVIASFKSIEAGSNGNWNFSAAPSSSNVKIGQEFNIQLNSAQTGYVYLLYVGSDNKEMYQVWPTVGNHIQIQAGLTSTPPLEMFGPPGVNTVLMVVSQQPADFSYLFNKNGAASINQASLSNLNCDMQQHRNIKLKEDSGCSGMKRNIGLKQTNTNPVGNVNGYAARMLNITGY